MNVIDIIIVIVLVCFAVAGLKEGFIRELFKLLGVVVAFITALNRMSWLVGILAGSIRLSPAFLTVISFVVIFVAVYIIMALAGWTIRKMVQLVFLGWLDAVGGAAFGWLKGVLCVSILLHLVYLLPLKTSFFQTMEKSRLVPVCRPAAPAVFNAFSAVMPGVQSFYHQFKKSITGNGREDFNQLIRKKEMSRFFEFIGRREI